MIIHVLIPSINEISISILNENGEKHYKKKLPYNSFSRESLRKKLLDKDGSEKYPNVAVMRLPYGGNVFSKPVLWSEKTKQQLQEISYDGFVAAYFVEYIEEYLAVFPDRPLILAFETSFFINLPAREAFYGVDSTLSEKMRIRKYGFHGLYHEYACFFARRQIGNKRNVRILSICLEPKTEIAAVIGNRPVMVSGGMTPLEGVPGEITCGKMDPAIVFEMITEHKLSIEEINELLCRKSGLSGIAEKHVTLPEVLEGKTPELKFACDVFFYHLLQTCGAGIAAMNGVDAIVFSGRYVNYGTKVGERLANMIKPSVKKIDSAKQLLCKEELDVILSQKIFISDIALEKCYADARSDR